MDFLRKLFGGGGSGVAAGKGDPGDRVGLYFYVQPTGCDEIVRVRIDRNNDLSLADDNRTYIVRKTARGTTYKCTRAAELELYFDSSRRLSNADVTGGKLVTQADYDSWVEAQGAGSASS